MDKIFTKNVRIFTCPACKNDLRIVGNKFVCKSCKREYGLEKGIPKLFFLEKENSSEKEITKIIKEFYEVNPFPNYEDLDSSESLREKSKEGVFANSLDQQIKNGAKVLEVGCGTGQLSNFLGLTWGRDVFGADMCMNSLSLGKNFKDKNKINNTGFLQMNLFKPAFKKESFDVVICNGVLHHTANPLLGFESISSLVKKNGYIVIGLYNTYGRLTTDIRRLFFNLTGNRFKFIDPRLRNRKVGNLRKDIWFMDQYKNPHESKHTIGEVLNWFDKTGFQFINSIPSIAGNEEDLLERPLFTKNSPSSAISRLFTQINMLFSGGKEGGFFIMIGQKK